MDPVLYNKRLQSTIYTGNPAQVQRKQGSKKEEAVTGSGTSFAELLQQKVEEEASVSFSKHAMERVVQRGIDVSGDKMGRLNQGVRMAEEKGLEDPLILIDRTAYLVNVKNNKVITVVNEDALKGSVFTNIDGTVMI